VRPEYLRDLAPGTQVIISDTVPGPPGEIIEVAFADLVGREAALTASSTPDQPLDEVIAMAELLRDEPLRGRLLALAVEAVDLTADPDPDAVETLRAAIADAIERLDRSLM
jgi:hypothetical protein